MGNMLELSPHPAWVDAMHRFVQPYWDALLCGDFAESAAAERLTIDELRGWMLHMYPFIHTFPKFLAEALIKVEDDESRAFLIDNIRVEKAHAEHWLWMAEGFGLPRADLLALAAGDRPALRDVQSLTDWLWHINTKGSLAEAVAATSYAIEGVTGDLTRKTLHGFLGYGTSPGVVMDNRTSRWMRSHARYDDEHPKLALEVIKRYATTERLQQKVMLAAKRSLELLDLAMTTSYRIYSRCSAITPAGADRRTADRRTCSLPTGFPERRFGERRGRPLRTVA
jgi:pyrroloquinoline quinone (PQQ) biosynthesis protein C